MSRRRIAQFEGPTHTVKVHRDTEWDEYRVTLVAANGDILSTYHSDDKEDAMSTAQSILKQAEPKPAPAKLTTTDFDVTVNAADLLLLLKAADDHAATLADRANNEPDSAERYHLDNECSNLRKKTDTIREKWCAGFISHNRKNK